MSRHNCSPCQLHSVSGWFCHVLLMYAKHRLHPLDQMHRRTQDFTLEGDNVLWGSEGRSPPELKQNVKLVYNCNVFPVENWGFNEYRSIAWTVYFANTRWKTTWRSNEGGGGWITLTSHLGTPVIDRRGYRLACGGVPDCSVCVCVCVTEVVCRILCTARRLEFGSNETESGRTCTPIAHDPSRPALNRMSSTRRGAVAWRLDYHNSLAMCAVEIRKHFAVSVVFWCTRFYLLFMCLCFLMLFMSFRWS